MEKLQEAAEAYIKTVADKRWNADHSKIDYIAGFEHSKEVIEELVKALEEANCYVPPTINSFKTKVVKLIQKHRNNEKQG